MSQAGTDYLSELALRLAAKAALEPDYGKRRDLEETAMAYWRAHRHREWPGPAARA